MDKTERLIEQLQQDIYTLRQDFQASRQEISELREDYTRYRLANHFNVVNAPTLIQAIANVITQEYGITHFQLIGEDQVVKAGRRPISQIKQEFMLDAARLYFCALVRQLTPLTSYPKIKESYPSIQTRMFREAGEIISSIYSNPNDHNKPQWRHLLNRVADEAIQLSVDVTVVFDELNELK